MSDALDKFFDALVRLEEVLTDLLDSLEDSYGDLSDVFDERDQ